MVLSKTEMIAIIGIIASVTIGVVSWFVSSWNTKRTIKRKELTFKMKLTPLIDKEVIKDKHNLKIEYNNHIIDYLVLLELDITNTGNEAVINPPMRIESKGSTYIIPGYIDEVPDGYNDLWRIEVEDGETVLIKADHIQSGQTIKARFILDEFPKENPMFICPVPDLKIKEYSSIDINPILKSILKSFYPNIYTTILRN